MTLRDDTDRKAPAVKLTENMRTVLERAKKQALQRRHTNTPGATPWPAHHSTLRRLVELELVTYIERDSRAGNRLELWEITPAGVQALEPRLTIIKDRPRYLAAAGAIKYKKLPPTSPVDRGRWTVDEAGTGPGDYTSDPTKSIDNDNHPQTGAKTAVEVLVTPTDLERYAEDAEVRHKLRLTDHGRRLDNTSLDARIANLQSTARANHVDLSSEMRLIAHMLTTRRTQDALRRITKAEARLQQRLAA